MTWKNANVLVTGGASFIGSHLTKELVLRGGKVSVADNLSSGKLDNLHPLLEREAIRFYQVDLKDLSAARAVMRDIDFVFHLAADHGGRGYIALHQAACATNLVLDGTVIMAAHEAGVRKLIFASSGCVYPNALQTNPKEEVYLRESMLKPPYEADNTYGWAKLMAELTLKAYYEEFSFNTALCRYFTVFGPGGGENHAIQAMIARAYIRQDPFEIWGDGTQVRNWTYVDDIVRGTILAAEKIYDATAVNLGTMDRITVKDAAELICDAFGYSPNFRFCPDMPTGPRNRVADNTLAGDLLGWRPQVSFADGLARTIDWYQSSKVVEEVRRSLPSLLMERG
jgi:nucleoside-diphosphate-sugar epimerase